MCLGVDVAPAGVQYNPDWRDYSCLISIDEDLYRETTEQAPWLIPDPMLLDSRAFVRELFKYKYKPVSTDTIVDKSFKELAFNKGLDFDTIGAVV